MRIASSLTLLALAALMGAGCAGPERKLGRGLLNTTEVLRLGEMRRSIEQTAMWGNTDTAYRSGVVRGFNRTVARTAVGVFEVATFPIPTPTYGPLFTSSTPVYPDPSYKDKRYPFGGMVLSEYPVYPDSYKPGLVNDTTFHTDTSLGFSGGDVAPGIPGSRFRIFNN